MEEKKTLLEMAVELDEMERDTTSAEADLLEKVLPRLKTGKALKPKEAERLEAMHVKYFGESEAPDEEGEEESGEEDL